MRMGCTPAFANKPRRHGPMAVLAGPGRVTDYSMYVVSSLSLRASIFLLRGVGGEQPDLPETEEADKAGAAKPGAKGPGRRRSETQLPCSYRANQKRWGLANETVTGRRATG